MQGGNPRGLSMCWSIHWVHHLRHTGSLAEPSVEGGRGAAAARAPGVMYFISNTLMLYGSNYIMCIFSDTAGDI